ncbi:hypothetical protein [Micromonospora sp. NPDC049662]|uniref:hypothetical protein n=1 Tax=Micromonospora sp. NPDC049662 TaxID=3155397 RepID=UPI00343B260E
MPAHDPTERALLARVAAHTRWAKTPDRAASTAAARQAFRDRFEREVDPEGVLPPQERARRAESARSAFYSRLALKSARARRLRREADELEKEADAGFIDADLIAEGGAA